MAYVGMNPQIFSSLDDGSVKGLATSHRQECDQVIQEFEDDAWLRVKAGNFGGSNIARI
jgi:hypothetical protein